MKDIADVLDAPTVQDRDRIKRIILDYEKKNPGQIMYTVMQAKQDQRDNSTVSLDMTKHGLVNKQAGRRHLLELPEPLVTRIQRSYPTMFSSRKHLAWFIKQFPQLLLPEKY